MKVIDVFEAYYGAECEANGRPRHAAKVCLTAESDAGQIRYFWQITFFPHDEEDDFAVSYDAIAEKVIYEGKGRRSKKKEAVYLEERESVCDELAREWNGRIFWDQLLREIRQG